jgi:hypothetical protein
MQQSPASLIGFSMWTFELTIHDVDLADAYALQNEGPLCLHQATSRMRQQRTLAIVAKHKVRPQFIASQTAKH